MSYDIEIAIFIVLANCVKLTLLNQFTNYTFLISLVRLNICTSLLMYHWNMINYKLRVYLYILKRPLFWTNIIFTSVICYIVFLNMYAMLLQLNENSYSVGTMAKSKVKKIICTGRKLLLVNKRYYYYLIIILQND